MDYRLMLLLLCVIYKADANSKLVIVGGMNRNWDRLDTLEVVQDGDPLCDDGIIEPMPVGRSSPVASMVNVSGSERIMVCGGEDGGNHKECYQYNGKNWTEVSSMLFSVNSAPSAVLGEKLYVFGGMQGMSIPELRHIQVYDIENNTWDVIPDILTKRPLYTCALEIEGKIVLIGERKNNKIYDGETLQDFPDNKLPRGSAGCALVELNGTKAIIVVGGSNSQANDNTEYIYWNSENPTNATWKMMKNKGVWKSRQFDPAIAQIQDKIIMAGGTRYWEDVEELMLDTDAEDVLHRAKWQLSDRYLIETHLLSTNLIVPKELISNCQ